MNIFGPDHSLLAQCFEEIIYVKIPEFLQKRNKRQKSPSLAYDACLWFQMTLFTVNRGLKSVISPIAAPSPTLHTKLQHEECQARNMHPTKAGDSLEGAPRALLCSFSSDQEGHSSCSRFSFVCGGFVFK